jgi:hypothetical protein
MLTSAPRTPINNATVCPTLLALKALLPPTGELALALLVMLELLSLPAMLPSLVALTSMNAPLMAAMVTHPALTLWAPTKDFVLAIQVTAALLPSLAALRSLAAPMSTSVPATTAMTSMLTVLMILVTPTLSGVSATLVIPALISSITARLLFPALILTSVSYTVATVTLTLTALKLV